MAKNEIMKQRLRTAAESFAEALRRGETDDLSSLEGPVMIIFGEDSVTVQTGEDAMILENLLTEYAEALKVAEIALANLEEETHTGTALADAKAAREKAERERDEAREKLFDRTMAAKQSGYEDGKREAEREQAEIVKMFNEESRRKLAAIEGTEKAQAAQAVMVGVLEFYATEENHLPRYEQGSSAMLGATPLAMLDKGQKARDTLAALPASVEHRMRIVKAAEAVVAFWDGALLHMGQITTEHKELLRIQLPGPREQKIQRRKTDVRRALREAVREKGEADAVAPG